MRLLPRLAIVLALAAPLFAQKFYTYVSDLGPNYCEITWGTADGVNTIGRSAPSHGIATIKIAGRTLSTEGTSIVVGNLLPDRLYPFEVDLANRRIGGGEVRTWPAQSTHLVFFVLGDFGTGNNIQFNIARVMWEEFQRRQHSDNPVRFILGMGDTIYGDVSGFLLGMGHTGKEDKDWDKKFFAPYESLMQRVPFFGVLGNHDGNETESHGDLTQFLDNMPYPGGKPARYFEFSYGGGLADFFGLDSTANTLSGAAQPFYLAGGAEFHWMQTVFPASKAQWKIPFMHHPPYSAGPLHPGSLQQLQHWVNLFSATGVKVVFSGHEHNLQLSDPAATYGIQFVVSGAGGELRPNDIQSKLRAAHIAYWAGQNHFLVVEIDGPTMRITPMSFVKLNIRDANGNVATPPFIVTLPQAAGTARPQG